MEFTHKHVHTNGIRMHVVEAGSGFPVLFCHGFPELWYSWRQQIKALAEAGFRAIAPDQRGYGDTDAPPAIEAPALMVTAELDVVLRPEMAQGMETWLPNLRRTVLIEGSGHWTQQEKPAEVNAALLEFLREFRG